jgi:hypothetical protein
MHAPFAMSLNQLPRPDDEDGMSPAEWLADSEVAVTDSHPRNLLLSNELIASMPEDLASGRGRG